MTADTTALHFDDLKAVSPNGQYRVIRRLACGEISSTWAVENMFLNDEVALKVLHKRFARSALHTSQFLREARILASARDMSIPTGFKYWEAADGRHCFVMKLLNGRNLEAELNERRRLPVKEVIRYGCHVLGALSEFHASGVVHRNINPKTIFLHKSKDRGIRAYALGFRLARNIAFDLDAGRFRPVSATRTRDRIGPTYFASPEALNGMHVDPRSDIYSVGVVLYTMILGQDEKHLELQARPSFDFSALRRVKGCNRAVERILRKALEPRVEDRYQTALEFLSNFILYVPEGADLPFKYSRLRRRYLIWSLERYSRVSRVD